MRPERGESPNKHFSLAQGVIMLVISGLWNKLISRYRKNPIR